MEVRSEACDDLNDPLYRFLVKKWHRSSGIAHFPVGLNNAEPDGPSLKRVKSALTEKISNMIIKSIYNSYHGLALK